MLRSVVICPDQKLSTSLQDALSEVRSVAIVRTLDHYPNHMDLVRFLRATAPQVVFLGIESRQHALELAEWIEGQQPGTQIIVINRDSDADALLEVMRAGIREFLAEPFDPGALQEALHRVELILDRKPATIESTDSVFSFLPAKAGVGASTLAVNASVAAAEICETKVLLMDFDLTCGIVGFMLRIDAQHSIVSAAEHALDMDEVQWQNIVTQRALGKLDVLPAGRMSPGFRIESNQIHHLLDFARRNYQAICLDLSGMMEKYSIEVLRESKRIFLVCTPEVPSLHLAREKLVYLRSLDLADRVSILLNRAHKRSLIPTSEVESVLGLPVFLSFPNDYEAVHAALTAGKSIKANSDLGKKCRSLAESMMASQLVTA
jgi:pilus assembly protein CpaE